MNYKELSEIEKRICINFMFNKQEELFEMILLLIEERIKIIVPEMIKEYVNKNPNKAVLDTDLAEKQLSDLFKNLKF